MTIVSFIAGMMLGGSVAFITLALCIVGKSGER